jgi:hypothetical protein
MSPPNKKVKTATSTVVLKKTAKDDDKRGKRKRRQLKGYEPDDFTMTSERAAAKEASVPNGRGVKLGEIPIFKAAIEKIPLSHEDLSMAYTFVFGSRSKVNKKEMKEKLLEFNGYLPALPKGKVDDAAMDKEEDKCEVGCVASFITTKAEI